MIFQISKIKDGVHLYRHDPEGDFNTEKAKSEINIPDHLCQDPSDLMDFYHKATTGVSEATT